MVELNIRIGQDCYGRSGVPRIAMKDQDCPGLPGKVRISQDCNGRSGFRRIALALQMQNPGLGFFGLFYLTLSKRRVTDVNFECLEIVCFGDKQCLKRCKSRGQPLVLVLVSSPQRLWDLGNLWSCWCHPHKSTLGVAHRIRCLYH